MRAFQRGTLSRTSDCRPSPHLGTIAVEWPPLRATGKPTVGGGANASVVATSARSDGKSQITYNGHPLYLFSADQKAGDMNGQGVNAFGGLWYVLSSTGEEITTSAGSGGGFGYQGRCTRRSGSRALIVASVRHLIIDLGCRS